MGLRLLLCLALVLGTVRGGGRWNRPQKWRQRLKALLYEYKTGGQEEGEVSRQVCSHSLTKTNYTLHTLQVPLINPKPIFCDPCSR